jgi:tol-pal system protein YbgF
MRAFTPLRLGKRGAALLFCVSAAFTSQVATAGLFDDDEARKAILELRERVAKQQEETDRKLAAQALRIDQLIDRLEKSGRAQTDANNDGMALRQELARLRGQVEVQVNEIGRVNTEIARVNAEAARLQKELSSAQTQQRALATTVDDRLKRVEPIQIALDGTTVAVDPRERQLYDSALAVFRQGDYRAALGNLARLTQEYPETPYLANAMFWIGSSHFGLKDYRSAITAQEAMMKRFPDHARSADAMLNLANAQIESNDKRNGRRSLEITIERYPQSAAAQAARERLTKLK